MGTEFGQGRSAHGLTYRHWHVKGRWKRRRREQLAKEPFCAMCLAQGVWKPASVADHIIPHKGDAVAFWTGKLQSLCAPHHDRDKQRAEIMATPLKVDADGWPTVTAKGLSPEAEARRMPQGLKPSAIPLTIVCGPPGSGKSTYVREHAGPLDAIIDLDAILAQLSGRPEHQAGKEWLTLGLEERNRQLRALHQDRKHAAAWFIIAASDPMERRLWAARLGGQLLVMDTPIAECIRRIRADPGRQAAAHRMIQAAKEWRAS